MPTSWHDWGGSIRSRCTRFGIAVGKCARTWWCCEPGTHWCRCGDGVDQHRARAGEKYGHTTAATFIKTPGHAPADALAAAPILNQLQVPGGAAQVTQQLLDAR